MSAIDGRPDMKTIVATVLLAAAMASSALAQSTSQQGARSGRGTQTQQGARSGQNAAGTYQGYPTSAWQRPGSW
jgi:hypothetical protein